MTRAAIEDTRFRLSEGQARALAEAYGTPLYVLDEAHLRARIRRFKAAATSAWRNSEIAYASKANSTLAVLAIAHQEGCKIDVASEGELRAALAAGVPAKDCHLHGSNKTAEELRFAAEQGVGLIVIDHFGEIEVVAGLSRVRAGTIKIALRLAPGVDPVTHRAISTGQADTKFGFNIADGSAERAALQCIEAGLALIGFHCHVGSQLLDPDAQEAGGLQLAKLAARMYREHGFAVSYINVGGGLGVAYVEGQAPTSVEEYCNAVAAAVRKELEGTGLEPMLAQEPGRALAAEAGVTLYRVGVVKTVPAPGRGTRTYVSVDGGLSDNPRPAMYGAKYTVERIAYGRSDERAAAPAQSSPKKRALAVASKGASTPSEHESAEMAGWVHDGVEPPAVPPSGSRMLATVSGKHCETDMLFEDAELPSDLGPGDILQVLCTGAYNSSMASNYNRYPRPATAMVMEDGSHALVQRRDSWDEMLAREILPRVIN